MKQKSGISRLLRCDRPNNDRAQNEVIDDRSTDEIAEITVQATEGENESRENTTGREMLTFIIQTIQGTMYIALLPQINYLTSSRSFNPATDMLRPIYQKGEPDTVYADTDILPSKWGVSADFAHGADTTIPMRLLIDRLLKKNETVAEISSLRWNRLMIEQMTMAASLKPFPHQESILKPTITAEFITTEGRTVYLRAINNGKQLDCSRVLARNSFAHQILNYETLNYYRSRFQEHFYEFGLNPLDEKLGKHNQQGMVISTFMDIINNALLILAKFDIINNSGGALVAGVENFQIPSYEDITSGENILKLRLAFERKKMIKLGIFIIPLEVSLFDRLNKKVKARGVYNIVSAL